MAKKTYSELLRDPRWQRCRAQVLNRDNYTCTLCLDDRTTLAVHHEEYQGFPWDISPDKLKTVCVHCHDIIHALPDRQVIEVKKRQSFTLKCWEMVAFTDRGIVFLYFFFSEDNTPSKPEIIIIHNNPKIAA